MKPNVYLEHSFDVTVTSVLSSATINEASVELGQQPLQLRLGSSC